MNNHEKIAELLRFYLLATKLKDILRSGPLQRNIERERVESVAEHVYKTCILAIAIDSEFDFCIDIQKVIMMVVIHELEEVVIGDLTPYDTIDKEEKLRLWEQAVLEILGNLSKKDVYFQLTQEYNQGVTSEARFAKMCDILEADIQMKQYEEEGAVSLERGCKSAAERENVQKYLSQGAETIADVWIECDRHCYSTSEVFTEILDFVKRERESLVV